VLCGNLTTTGQSVGVKVHVSFMDEVNTKTYLYFMAQN
jgi:hypothetical protein